MDVEGVKAIKCLKVFLCDEEDRVCAYDNEWCLDICQYEQSKADKAFSEKEGEPFEKYKAKITCKHKPVLHFDTSVFKIKKGGLKIPGI